MDNGFWGIWRGPWGSGGPTCLLTSSYLWVPLSVPVTPELLEAWCSAWGTDVKCCPVLLEEGKYNLWITDWEVRCSPVCFSLASIHMFRLAYGTLTGDVRGEQSVQTCLNQDSSLRSSRLGFEFWFLYFLEVWPQANYLPSLSPPRLIDHLFPTALLNEIIHTRAGCLAQGEVW